MAFHERLDVRDLNVLGNQDVDGTLNVDGAATIGGALHVTGNISQDDVSRVYKTSNATLTAAEMRGTTIVVNGSGAVTLTLPAVAKGLRGTFISVAAQTVNVKAGASDKITLHATALDDGDKVSSAGAAGNMIEIRANSGGTDWETGIFSGTWSDGGA